MKLRCNLKIGAYRADPVCNEKFVYPKSKNRTRKKKLGKYCHNINTIFCKVEQNLNFLKKLN